MPVPYRDADEVEELGAAGFLKIEERSSASEFLAALFLVNARGEPLEFAYNRIEAPNTVLWRPSDLRRYVERKLTASLLQVCSRVPSLLLCLADEIGSELFCQDIRLSIPVGRIGEPLKVAAHSANETQEILEEPTDVHVFWFPGSPASESVERRLFNRLSLHGLLIEPFQRASLGLREVYPNGHAFVSP
jgi:hypothetical protein